LGEVSVFDGGPYSATAVAIEPTTLLRFQGEHFRAMCHSFPSVALKVIRVLGHTLRYSKSFIEELSFATVRDRLIAHLLRLAGRLGTVRELVSRNLGHLHGEGLIAMRRRAVTIPDEVRLRAELKS
jgi:CRP-like cAMP-binding protein